MTQFGNEHDRIQMFDHCMASVKITQYSENQKHRHLSSSFHFTYLDGFFSSGVVKVDQNWLFFREQSQDFVHCFVLGTQGGRRRSERGWLRSKGLSGSQNGKNRESGCKGKLHLDCMTDDLMMSGFFLNCNSLLIEARRSL